MEKNRKWWDRGEREERSLGAKEWLRVQDAILYHIDVFMREKLSKHELRFFMFLFNRTLRFNKFTESVKVVNLMRGYEGDTIFSSGIPCHRSTLFRIRASLVKRHVIEYMPNREGVFQSGDYRLNVPGMLKVVLKHDFVNPQCKVNIAELYSKVMNFWEKSKWKLEDVVVSDDLFGDKIREGKEKHRKAAEKNREKRKLKDMKAIWIMDEMRSYCHEFGLRFFDKWTGKEYGSASNWVKECKRLGADPHTILYEIVKFWPDFKRGRLNNMKTGLPIILADTVSFSAFFVNRREILTWIEENRDAPKKHNIGPGRVVSMEEWIRELRMERGRDETEKRTAELEEDD